MTAENKLSAPKRRTRAEVQKLVAEFRSSICPTNPSRVQFPMAMVPPGLHTRSSSRATSSGRGANMAPTRLVTTSKLASSNGSASASPSMKRALRPSALARACARSIVLTKELHHFSWREWIGEAVMASRHLKIRDPVAQPLAHHSLIAPQHRCGHARRSYELGKGFEHGPTNRAFASLDETAARELRQELEALWSAHNRGGDELTVVQSEYLEVLGVRA
jgi:hypothetical protein